MATPETIFINSSPFIRENGSMRKCSILLSCAVLALMFFDNCTSRVGSDARSAAVLNIGNYAEPQDLDPHIITGVTELNIIASLLEGLVSEDPQDLHPVPGVARSWEASSDGMSYTFHLRADARWSNGDPVTSRDFAWSFRRILMPGLGAEYAYMLYPIKGAEEFNKGKTSDTASLGVQTPDDTTLTIALARPTPYFLSLLNHNAWFPVHRPTVEKFGKIDARGTPWTKQGNFVGNGPFALKTWEINKVITVGKSSTYWDRDRVKLDAINFYPVDNMITEERMFQTGQLDITHGLPPAKIDYYRQNHPELLHIDPYLATYFYLFNVARPPLNDQRVRRALAMTIDRESIVKNVTKGGQNPAYAVTPPNTAGYTAQPGFSMDVAAAKKLLAEAGYPDGKGFPQLEVLYNTSETHQLIAQAIQEMWKQNLNIQVSLVNQEWRVYQESQTRRDYAISRFGWTGDYNDPNTFLDMWTTGNGNNRAGWSNATYDSLIAAASLTFDKDRRYACFQEAEKILLTELPVVPIYFYTNVTLRSRKVKGWNPTILDHHPYKYVWIEKKS